jgi:uncharacterized protein (TIGR00730 family)
MKRICVYCGSSPGRNPRFREAAVALGHVLVRREIGLVYGGASVGIMGTVADAVLERGGEVTGVIPSALDAKEITHPGLTQQHVVASMHERKALMAELSDGFIALPGGWGTFEEIFEILTWAQLGFHQKPCGLLNESGYYDHLAMFLEHAIDQQFVKPECRPMLMIAPDADSLLEQFDEYRPVKVRKWISSSQT